MDYQKLMDFFNESDRFCKHNGIRVVCVREGYAEVEVEVAESLLNGADVLQGGAMMTMADAAAGTAMLSHGNWCCTMSCHTEFIRSAKAGKVRAIATEVSRGKTLARFDVSVYDETQTVIGKCLVVMFDLGKPIGDMMAAAARI